ncbi:flagellar export chaperone FlgN [Janthinobacterium psychrotolerans]|uniref:Flagella synthesis protein FlgN n=1 Tax=Janthinobacterium psychrotolerans TaxID=1747903 RepID=A0A1A7C9C6_9BURK|nr:flagellar export chaperone FlgN [Janthinobacterium psychrotolerans]OBV40913.1 flagella synthesis protein FlgN [Janthinobacterium psychrotolerans]
MSAPRKGMTRQEAVQRVLQGIGDDRQAYGEMLELLEKQFQATLRHQTGQLKVLAEQVVAAADLLDGRRRQRMSLATALLGPKPAMAQLFALLQADAQARAIADWEELEQMVVECKRLNTRNSQLLTEQYTTMQRVLHGEEHIYAPG